MRFKNLRKLRQDLEDHAGLRIDVGETAMFARQLEFIYSAPFKVEQADLKARTFFPLDTSVAAWALNFTYRMFDRFGQAAIISNYADDLPRVDVLGKEFTFPVKSIGDAYGYSVMDILASTAPGAAQLDTMRSEAAMRAYEEKFDDLAAFGSTAAGLNGVTNHASIPLVVPDFAPWDLATPLEIISDMNKLASAPAIATRRRYPANRMLLDDASFELVSTKPMSSTGDSDKTVLRFFLDNNPYIQGVDVWDKLNDAGAAGVTRAMAYRFDPNVIRLVEPKPFTQLPPQWRNLEALINCWGRMGGAMVVHPLGAAYMDGTGE